MPGDVDPRRHAEYIVGMAQEQNLARAERERDLWREAHVSLFDWISRMNEERLGGEFIHGDCQAADDAKEAARRLVVDVTERVRARDAAVQAVRNMSDAEAAELRKHLKRGCETAAGLPYEQLRRRGCERVLTLLKADR